MLDDQSHIEIHSGSERGFGLVIGAVLAIIGLWPLLHGGSPRPVFLALAAALIALALLVPRTLRRANALWFRLGLLLGAIVAPIVMTLVYALTVVPIGLYMRLRGRDLLGTRFEPERESYWIERESAPQSLRKQY